MVRELSGYGGLKEHAPPCLCIWTLGLHPVLLCGTYRRWGLCGGGSMSLEQSTESQFTPSSACLRLKMWALSLCLSAPASKTTVHCHDNLTASTLAPYRRNSYISCRSRACHSNRTVTSRDSKLSRKTREASQWRTLGSVHDVFLTGIWAVLLRQPLKCTLYPT